jgi:hypothetical protein
VQTTQTKILGLSAGKKKGAEVGGIEREGRRKERMCERAHARLYACVAMGVSVSLSICECPCNFVYGHMGMRVRERESE